MVNVLTRLGQQLSAILMVTALTACGSSSSSTTPTSIPSISSIFYAHNLVFRNSTTLATGYNGFGQLGTGDLGNRDTLGKLEVYYPFKGFATGGDHSVAFINNSTVMSWGYNNYGQLGNKSTKYSDVPVATAAIRGVRAVAAGAYHTLALKNDDTLWAWGYNGTGQLGVATNDQLEDPGKPDPGYRTVPVQVNGGGVIFSNISSISANAYHSLARANGSVWAWGFNGTGQLGIDPAATQNLASPSIVAGLPSGGIDAIASGGAFNCALARNGEIWAWGYNATGQLGNNSTVVSYLPVRVLKAPGVPLTGVTRVSAGLQHGLALLNDGTVWAWGYNAYWQLGNNSNLDSPVAVRVWVDNTGTVFLGNATEIRAFGNSSMAKVGGAWYVWGDNTSGQLGIGSTGRIPFPEKMSGF